jgi:formylmethanofuran dehydrogenase subunit E
MTDNRNAILTEVKDALTSAVNVVANAQKALFAQANTEKASLITLLKEMAATRKTVIDLAVIAGEAGSSLLDIEELGMDVGEKIFEVLAVDEDVPAGPYETFVEWCDDCGKELHISDAYTTDGKGFYQCEECAKLAAEAETDEDTEDENTEGEQIAIDIPETVVAENA